MKHIKKTIHTDLLKYIMNFKYSSVNLTGNTFSLHVSLCFWKHTALPFDFTPILFYWIAIFWGFIKGLQKGPSLRKTRHKILSFNSVSFLPLSLGNTSIQLQLSIPCLKSTESFCCSLQEANQSQRECRVNPLQQ